MSNVIKADSIRYKEDKRLIDMNERSEAIVKKFLSKHPSIKSESGTIEGFVAGIPAVSLNISEDYDELTQDQLLKLNEPQIDLSEEYELRRGQIEEEMRELLENAKKEAESIKIEAKKQVEKEKQIVLKKAKEDGYREGMLKKEEEIAKLRADFEAEVMEFQNQQEKTLAQMEPNVVSLVIEITKKLTGILAEDRKDIILYLIEQAFFGYENSKSFIIRVSREDYELVNSKKTELLWKLKEDTILEIMDDPMLHKTQCLIETESRIIDCSLDVQLFNLTQSLKMLI